MDDRSIAQSSIDGIEVVDAMRVSKMTEHMNEYAKQGYRYVIRTTSSRNGGSAVMILRERG